MELKGLATGIGSLPYKDADPALDLIFKYVPEIPFWPQLPKRDVREGMLAQFSEKLPCLRVSREGVFFSAFEDKDKELEAFYEHIISGDVDYFKISADFASGLHKFYQRLEVSFPEGIQYIKCHVTGAFTFAAGLKDEEGNALLHNPVFMQAIIKGLAMKALWQINLFRKFNKKIIVFVDEPYLGCFGSAYTPVNREDVLRGLGELTQALKAEGALVGVHCCGNTDWSIFTDTEGIDIINFDASGFLERLCLYSSSLKSFFKRGGMLCWGIVPTQELSSLETAGLLVEKIKAGVEAFVDKGLDRELLLDRLMISPACGLGTLDTASSEKIFKLLSEVSFTLRGQTP